MIINHNLSAINSHRMMKINNFQMDLEMQRLSSGLRINLARDDAAGLAVSEKMRAQVRGLHQASRNTQDAISMIQTAEGWMNETGSILQRMGELTVQAANGTYTDADRTMIQVEIDQLTDELDRIASHAEFNTILVLSGTLSRNETANAAGTNKSEGGLWVHLGANTDQRERVFINAMDTKFLFGEAPATAAAQPAAAKPEDAANVVSKEETTKSTGVSVRTVEEANRSINVVHDAVVKVATERAKLGAFQNRLEMSIKGIDNAAENLQAAESRIRDADMAKEMIEYVRAEILTTSAASMLAQANITPQLVLRILR